MLTAEARKQVACEEYLTRHCSAVSGDSTTEDMWANSESATSTAIRTEASMNGSCRRRPRVESTSFQASVR